MITVKSFLGLHLDYNALSALFIMRIGANGAGGESPEADLVLMAEEDKTAAYEIRREPTDYMDEDELLIVCSLYFCHKKT